MSSASNAIGQKAPSTKRCIKTWRGSTAGSGDLLVRKHRAPKGALRRVVSLDAGNAGPPSQKAPSIRKFRMQFP